MRAAGSKGPPVTLRGKGDRPAVAAPRPPGLLGGAQREGVLAAAAHLRVDVRVLLQADHVAEGLAADVTGEGPGPAVGATGVHLQPVWGGEDLGVGQYMKPPGSRRWGSLPSVAGFPVCKVRLGGLEGPSPPFLELNRQPSGLPLALISPCCVLLGK